MIYGIRIVLCLECEAGMLSVAGTKFPGNSIQLVAGVQLKSRLVSEQFQYSSRVTVNQSSSRSVTEAR